MVRVTTFRKFLASLCLLALIGANLQIELQKFAAPKAEAQAATFTLGTTDAVRAFANAHGANIPTAFNGAGMVRLDATTATKLCNLAGYTTVAGTACTHPGENRCNYTSCGDNSLHYWNGAGWVGTSSCGGQWLAQLVCTNPVQVAQPRLEVDKQVSATVQAGGQVTYTYVIRNSGAGNAASVNLVDFFIDNNNNALRINPPFTYVSSTGATCGWRAGEKDFLCQIGALNAGQSKTVTMTFNVPANQSCDQQIMNQADVHLGSGPVDGISNWDKVATTVKCAPTPNCPATSTTASFQGSQGPWDHQPPAGDAKAPTLAIANLTAGQTVTATSIVGRYSGRIYHGVDQWPLTCEQHTEGSFTNNANQTIAKIPLVNFKNGVQVPAGATRLYVHAAQNVNHHDYFDNSGNRQPSSGPIPPCQVTFSYAAAVCNVNQCQDGRDNDGDGLIDFPSDPGCSNPDDNDESPVHRPNLAVDKQVSATVQAGGQVTYTYIVSNTGNAPALPGVNMIDYFFGNGDPLNRIQPPFQFVGSTGATCTWRPDETDFLCPVGSLAAGASKTITMTFNVPSNQFCGQQIMNQADVHLTTGDIVGVSDWDKVATTVQCAPQNQCQDGVDNDQDGRIDFPNDPGCVSPTDNNESDEPACKNNKDDDGDGKIDMADPGCSNPDDNSETDIPQCSDGIDNDGDGATDLADFSCSGPTDNDETNPKAQCQDGFDNDNDGKIDFPQDPGCTSRQDNDEFNVVLPQCKDGIDNDNDGKVDMQDPGCSNPDDNNEGDNPQCSDNADNDQDGRIDFPQDPGCVSPTDNNESDEPACKNNKDDDGDGKIDMADPGCSNPDDNNESDEQQCQDGRDNDNDGKIDFPNDPGCVTPTDNDETDPVQNADLSITKSGPTTVTRGGTISYTLTATNHGPSTANTVVITDVIPSGLTFNAGLSAGCVLNAGQTSVLCNNFSLTSGASKQFTVTFNVPAVANCQTSFIQNVATVASSTTDLNSNNNTSQAVVSTVNCPQPTPQCRDGLDNDNDGKIDLADPGCSNQDDDNEGDEAQCQDLRDNDNDGRIDFPQDPGCVSPTDNNESDEAQCKNNKDDDGDGKIDMADPGCSNPDDNNESDNPQCSDNLDNDQDGRIDFPQDPGCVSPTDNNESDEPACKNNKDDDGDGLVDMADPGCQNPDDPNEGDNPQCSDGIDNDQDGATDLNDFSCSGPTDNDETNPKAQCQDGVDNDNDGLTDFPADPGCSSKQDNDESNAVIGTTLTVEKTTTQSTIGKNEPIFYQIKVRNTGNALAQNVKIIDNVPFNLTFVSDGSTAGCTLQTVNAVQQVQCTPFDLAAGQSQTVTLKFMVGAGATCNATLRNQADAEAANAPLVWDDVTSTITCPTLNQCQDGLDNDADGRIDMLDPGCSAPTDNNEGDEPACKNNKDDDNDGKIDMQDPGCSNPDDNNEGDNPQCSDGIDNDADGRIDMLDPGCSAPTDNNEGDEPACKNNKDDDNDGKIDMQDPGCSNPDDTSEADNPQCSDNLDNDADGRIDMLDPGCSAPTDNNESDEPACKNNKDDDGDGLVDLQDPGCQNPDDTDEGNNPQCSDNIDNDGDGAVDSNDFSCSGAQDNDETNPKAQCQDNIDNDGDGQIDFPNDPGCSSKQDNDEFNAAATVDLNIIKSTTQTTVNRGGQIVYTITVTNSGNAQATNVVVNDPIPTGLEFVSSAGASCAQNTATNVACTLGAMAAGSSRTFTLTFNVPNVAVCTQTTVFNQATVSATEGDSNTSNNTSTSVPVTVLCPVQQLGCIDVVKEAFDPNGNQIYTVPQFSFTLDGTRVALNDVNGRARFNDVAVGTHTVIESVPQGWTLQSVTPNNGTVNVTSGTSCAQVLFRNRQNQISGGNNFTISIDDDEDEVEPEDELTYDIDVRNNTNTTVTNATVTVTLDDEVNFDDCSDNCTRNGRFITWTNLTFGPNEQKEFDIDVEVDEDADDELRTTATIFDRSDTDKTDVEEDDDDVDSDNDDDEASMDLIKEASTAEVFPGGVISYTLRIRNTGDTELRDITVVDRLPFGTTIISDGNADRRSGNQLTWEIDHIARGGTWTATYRISVDTGVVPGTILRNDVRATTDDGDISEAEGVTVGVIGNLPQTGFMGPGGPGLKLKPIHGTSSASVPLAVLISLIGLGTGAGMGIGRKYFFSI